MTAPTPVPPAVSGVRWCLVVPVKPLGLAKSRLRGPGTWISDDLRPRLALAFAADAVEAALRASSVAEAVVVTDDPDAARVLGDLGACIVPDMPDAGLNAALAYGAQVALEKFGDIGVAALAADLPALRPDELDEALSLVSTGRFFVPDAHDIGTTMLFASPGVALDPRFGGPSRASHEASGAVAVTGIAGIATGAPGAGSGITTLRRDVDTPEDLAAAVLLGVGPRTSALLV